MTADGGRTRCEFRVYVGGWLMYLSREILPQARPDRPDLRIDHLLGRVNQAGAAGMAAPSPW